MASSLARTSAAPLAFADNARVLGISFVVLQHFIGLSVTNAKGSILSGAAYLGTLGVALLFVLSGYLLSRPYLAAILDDRKMPATKDFYLKRLLRIYPLFAFAVVTIGLLNAFDGKTTGSLFQMILEHLSLVFNFSQVTAEQIESPMWTMAVDAQFYLVLPIVFGLLGYCMRSLSIVDRKIALATVLVVAIIASVLIRFIVVLREPQSVATFAAQIVYLKQLPEMAGAFAAGIAVALFEPELATAQRPMFLLAGIALAIIHAASRFALKDPKHVFGYTAGFATYDAIAAIAAALILIGLPRGREHRVLLVAASVCYAVYLFHDPLFGAVVDATHVRGLARPLVLVATFVFFVLPISWAAHIFIEAPFLKMKSRVGSGMGSESAATAVTTTAL